MSGAPRSPLRPVNAGEGPRLVPFDIGHERMLAFIDPDSAFWMLVPKSEAINALSSGRLHHWLDEKRPVFLEEMRRLRSGLQPSAVYFNPTARCNLDCSYCYIPAAQRRGGPSMTPAQVEDALVRLKENLGGHGKPQVIFHGAEPLLNREAIFPAIERFADEFRFGVQTNGTLLDDEAARFLMQHGVSIGISLDGARPETADAHRRDWKGDGAFDRVVQALDRLKGYRGLSVLAVITRRTVDGLSDLVRFLHERGVHTCMLNALRCTQPRSLDDKPDESLAAARFIEALETADALRRETGRKIVVANFANALIGILAPTARRLMCDLSPCGAGRCFVALAADGGLYPCSEFVGLDEFRGGNLFTDPFASVLASAPFLQTTTRRVEAIPVCADCAIRNFCGAPCPAEAHASGGLQTRGVFCDFYVEQIRYALRLVADGRAEDFLWDGWDQGANVSHFIDAL